jgi:hypothetical protein
MPKPLPPTDAVDPEDRPGPSGKTELERKLLIAGLAADDVPWLADEMLSIIAPQDAPSAPLSDAAEWRLRQCFDVLLAAERDRDASLLALCVLLCGGIRPYRTTNYVDSDPEKPIDDFGWSIDEDRRRAVVATFLSHGADFDRALEAGWPKPLLDSWKGNFSDTDSPLFATTRCLLLSTGAIHLERIIDLDELRRSGANGIWGIASGGGSSEGARTWNDGVDWSHPRSLRVWIWYEGPGVLNHILPAFQAEPAATRLDLAAGILSEILNTFGGMNEHHPLSFECASPELRTAIRPFFEQLTPLLEEPELKVLPALREVWLIYFRLCYDGDPKACPPDTGNRVLAMATEDLSRMRKVFHDANQPGDTPEAATFLHSRNHFDNCCIALCRHGSVWKCLKPLLLGLRALNTPCVAKDLRFWVEQGLDVPPEPWCHLPNMMAVAVHSFAAEEERDDEDLTSLREDFATFCLERLTDTKKAKLEMTKAPRPRTNEDLVERVDAWRFCLIRAVSDLRANPEGRGHRTLHWSAENDPNELVQKAAQQAYHTIRHARGLPERVSPRRAVMSAVWWLRQAHLLGLGIQPDRDMAQRTREKELTRVKQSERTDTSS